MSTATTAPTTAPTAGDLAAIRGVGEAVSASHLFAYLIPEAAEEAAALGVTDRSTRYLALRAAALGAVPWPVVQTIFYGFSPRLVRVMEGVWDVAPPERWQAARLTAVGRALARVGVRLTPAEVAEARSLIDPVVAAAELAAAPMAAANAAVPLPAEPLVALWQQVTVAREWRGDAHIGVLVANRLGPCESNLLHAATGRLPLAVLRATRGWDDAEWAAAGDALRRRGWLDADGAATDLGRAERERIEVETDERCRSLWAPIGAAGARRLSRLLAPIDEAFVAAGTYAALR